MRFILASASPRRRELLASIRMEFDVIPSHIPEERGADEAPHDYVGRLSREKAEAIAAQHPDRWIIAADTTVVVDDDVLEKPADAADARRMLAAISGRSHVVFTGVTLRNASRDYLATEVTESKVTVLPLSEDDIARYVQTGEPMDKAGAYAVQGIGALFIDAVDGSYTNVVGLPIATLFRMLRGAGLDPLRAAVGA